MRAHIYIPSHSFFTGNSTKIVLFSIIMPIQKIRTQWFVYLLRLSNGTKIKHWVFSNSTKNLYTVFFYPSKAYFPNNRFFPSDKIYPHGLQTSKFCKSAKMLLTIVRNGKVQLWSRLQGHDIHRKFNENLSTGSKAATDGHIHNTVMS